MNHTYTLTLLYTADQLRMEKHRTLRSKVKEIELERDYWLDCLDDAVLRTKLRAHIIKHISKSVNRIKKFNSNNNKLILTITK